MSRDVIPAAGMAAEMGLPQGRITINKQALVPACGFADGRVLPLTRKQEPGAAPEKPEPFRNVPPLTIRRTAAEKRVGSSPAAFEAAGLRKTFVRGQP